MIAIHVDRATVTYIAQPVFRELSWEIHDDRCVGLVGPNGCGKSTLLRLLAGELHSDTGYLNLASDISIGYLQQEPQFVRDHTVWQEALIASTDLAAVEAELSQIEARLADPAVYSDEHALETTLEAQTMLLERYEALGGPGYEGRVRSTLLDVGFAEADFGLPIDALSGGQKKLLGLAKLLITQPTVLLLDEPDNHLDLAGKRRLEQLIRNHKGAVVLVSHDRYLLDLVVDEIVELEDGRLTRYVGDYSEYAFDKQSNLMRQQQLFQTQQNEITRLEQAAKRLLTWGRVYDNEKLIKRGQNILKRIERIDLIDKPILERRQMDLTLGGWRGSNKVLEVIDLDKIFARTENNDTGAITDEVNIVLAGLDLLLWRGERVGLVGPNGAGKSVLFQLIRGHDMPSGGEIRLGPSVEIGYYAQEHETLAYERTLIDTIRDQVKFSESQAVSFLGKFLFSYEQARSQVATLSGGERSRLQMALLMLSNANFLLLDEPTNNLDIASAEVLEDAIGDFDGTVLVISHDRYFLDRVVDRVIELDNGRLIEFIGNYSDYEAAKIK